MPARMIGSHSRRQFLKTIAAAGVAASGPALPVLAEEKGSASSQVLAETLARYAVNLKYEDIPEDVVRIAKRTILDTIGCTYGGYDAGPSKIAILDLVSRIKVMPSDEADRTENEFNLCEMEVLLKSGARKTSRVEYHRGHFKNPMTDAEMEEKFRLMAQTHLSAERVDKLLRIRRGIENEPQVANLIAATVV
jgi:2-methylcitrate dehydratase PrpD